MRRLLALVMLTGSLWLANPPAYAALTVSVTASRTTLMVGEQVTLRGKASGAAPRSLVRLQYRTDGTWRTVASTRISSTRTYRFTVKPPRGYQDYRVRKPAQLGQPAATSAVLRLTVRWQPALTGKLVNAVDPGTGAVTSTVTGHATGLTAGTKVRREVLSGTSWTTQAELPIDASLNWSDTFASVHVQHIRYVVPAAGPRLAATSPEMVVDGHWTPTITAGATMDPVTDTATASGTVEGVPAGTTLTLERYNAGWQTWNVVGDTVVADDHTFTDSFTATFADQYRYTSPMDGPREWATSPPFTVADGPAGYVALNATTPVKIPGGSAERTVLVHLLAGQTFTVYDGGGGPKVTMTDPSGAALLSLPFYSKPVTTVAPVTGDYAITVSYLADVWPTTTVHLTISTPLVVDVSLDSEPFGIDSQLPGQVVDLVFDPSGSQVVSEYGTRGYWETLTMLNPTGERVPEFGWLARDGQVWRLPTTSGKYTLRITNTSLTGDLIHHPAVSVLSARTGQLTVDGGPVHVDLDRPGRVAALDVTVPAGLDVLLSDTGLPYALEDVIDPDGTRVFSNYTQQTIAPTQAGTYTLLTSVDFGDWGPQQVDYYASTPVEYDATVGGDPVPYDQGPAPVHAAIVHVTGDPGQVFSYAEYDTDGQPCRSPLVYTLPESGTLDLRESMCSEQGTIHVLPTTVATFDPETDTATFTVTLPGQVSIVDYDAGTVWDNMIELKSGASTFPAGTKYWFELGGVPNFDGKDVIDVGANYLTGPQQWFLWAGPTATGSLDVQITQTVH